MVRKKISGTWYRATFEDGTYTSVACCPDLGTVSLGCYRPWVDLFDWTEQGLRALLEKTFGRRVTKLAIS